jgi:transposase
MGMNQKNAHKPDWKEQRRWRALELKRDGLTHEEVAEALDVTKGAVSQWMKRVAEEGEEGLCARPHPGAIPKLTLEQKELLPDFLSHGSEAYGFRGEFWNSARVGEVIWREFEVRYHKNHIPRLLHRVGWTPQLPIERASQRDEERIARWRKEVWPELKKRLSRSGAPPFLLTKRRFTSCPES